MDFKTSQTMYNLARAFAGESQARTRYAVYAKVARKENYQNIAQVFEYTAHQELAHAEAFLNNIVGHYGQNLPNLNVNAGYPFEIGTTLENLGFAKQAETDENTSIYPNFAKIAQEEGFDDIARLFTLISKVEGRHANKYDSLFERMNKNTLYTSSFPTLWVCETCGYAVTAETPWTTCPVCGNNQGYIEMTN